MGFYLEDHPRLPLGVPTPTVGACGSTLLTALSASRRADSLFVPVRAALRTCTLELAREDAASRVDYGRIMATDDRVKWDEMHAAPQGEAAPSAFLTMLFKLGSWRVQPGKALDIAAGKGRNALFLADKGFSVEAIDISDVALQEARRRAETKHLAVTVRQADLDKAELPEADYSLILNINFLQRSLIPKIKRALKLGGHIIFDTYLVDQRVLGHPKNPDYLLGHNELLELFRDFRVLYYREGKFVDGEKESYRAGLFAQKVR